MLLHFLFSDPNVAYKFHVWKPVGDSIIAYLNNIKRTNEIDPYNLSMENFGDDEKWKSPLYVGIHFFDIMISSALHKNLQWHMWVYYFPIFIEKILKNDSLTVDAINSSNEFKTRYHYIINEIIYVLTRNIRAVLEISEQKNTKLESIGPKHENGNIPKSCMIALEQCLFRIGSHETIYSGVYKNATTATFSLYFDLCQGKETKKYAQTLKLILEKNIDPQKSKTHTNRLVEAFESFDKTPYKDEHVKEFRKWLNEKTK